MVKTIQNVSCKTEMGKLETIVKKQMEFLGSKQDLDKINFAIRNALGNNRALFFVKINEKDEYIGFSFCNISSGLETGADYIWINEIYVEPEYRRQGIATEIITFIEKWAKEKNIKYIATMTGKSNEKSMGLFRNSKYDLEEIIWIDKKIT